MPPATVASSPSQTWQTSTWSMSTRCSSEELQNLVLSKTWIKLLLITKKFPDIYQFHAITSQPRATSSLGWGAAIGIFLGAFAVPEILFKF